MNKLFVLYFTCFMLSLYSCNKIEDRKSLSEEDIKFITSLNLLDEQEKVYMFYSEYKKDVAGNFFTNKRIATYWIDTRNKNKNELSSAYYKEIKSIDTIYNAGATYTPYMLVTKGDGTQFKVSVDGKKEEVKSFFEAALLEWQRNIKKK